MKWVVWTSNIESFFTLLPGIVIFPRFRMITEFVSFILVQQVGHKLIRYCSLLHYFTDISAPASQWKFMSDCQKYQRVVICHGVTYKHKIPLVVNV